MTVYMYMCIYVYMRVFIHTRVSTNKCVFVRDTLTPQKLQKSTKVLEFSGWKVA